MQKIAITGATSGIGLETAKALLKEGNELIFFIRNVEKAEQLLADFPHPHPDKVKLIHCDLSDLQSVQQAGQTLLKQTDSLEVLINNAGGTFNSRKESKDGLEMHFAVNHLGHFLLVQTLLPLLQKSNTKIINVSSEAHRAGKLNFEDINLEKTYSPVKAYGNAKLCNIYFTKSLADRGFTSYALHPGVIDSGFERGLPKGFKWIWKLGKPFMKTPEKGARTSIYLAKEDLPAKLNGRYFMNRKPFRESSLSKSKSEREKLWSVSEKIIADKLS